MADQDLTEERIQQLLLEHVRARNKDAVSALKMVKTKISTEKGRLKNVSELPPDAVLKLVQREIREIRETIESLQKAGLGERLQEEHNKLKLLEDLLPAGLSEEDILKFIDETAAEQGRDNFGKVMKAVMGKVAGRAEGKLVSELVKKRIGG